MNHNTELEWQFEATELAATRAWLAAQPRETNSRRFSARSTLELRDTYYDSRDFMIFRAGFALRLRRSRADGAAVEAAEVTLKSLHAARGGLARRLEISQRVGSADMTVVLGETGGIGDRIRELTGTRPINELFRASTRRERHCLLEADTELPLAEFDLDETLIEAAGTAKSLQRVEIECLHAEPAALESVVESLREAAHLAPVEASKFRTGIELAGLDPAAAVELGPRTIHASQPFVESLPAVLRRYFAVVLDQEPKVRAGSVDAVHEMRVAARHLDVLLRAARAFAPSWGTQAHGAIRALARQLGAVRDCDVQILQLDSTMKSMSGDDREALVPLRERLRGLRDRARDGLLRELDSPRARAFHDGWLTNLRAAPAEIAPGAPATGIVALEIVRRHARKLRRRAEAIDRHSSADDYHEVRIRAKRLRYVLDAFESLYGPAAREFVHALARLQNVLGAFHDASVRDQRFSELVTSGALPPATSYAIGRLVERDVAAFDDCRRKFAKAYRRIRRRRWRALVAAMRRQAESAVPAPAT